MRKPARPGSKLAAQGAYTDTSDRSLQGPLTLQAKIVASLYPFRAVFAAAGFVIALKGRFRISVQFFRKNVFIKKCFYPLTGHGQRHKSMEVCEMSEQRVDKHELIHSRELANVTANASMEARKIISTYLDSIYGVAEEASEIPAKRANDFYHLCLLLATDIACRGLMLVKKEDQQAEREMFFKRIEVLVGIYNKYGFDHAEKIFDEIMEELSSQGSSENPT